MKVPHPFQEQVIAAGVARNVLIGDSCGLGKTLDAIEIYKRMRGEHHRALVVCPLRVLPQWVEEIADQDPGTPVQVIDLGNFHKWEPKTMGWTLMHYELVSRKEVGSILYSRVWDCIFIDEAHRIKNRNVKWTKAIKHIPVYRKVALTGTPMEQSPADMWSLCNWLYPEQFRGYWAFYAQHVEEEETIWGYKKIVGVKNPEALAKRLQPFFYQRTKEQVAPDLPPRIMQTVDIKLLPEQRRIYDTIHNAKDLVVNIDDQELIITNVLARIVRLQQIASDPISLGFQAASAKIDWVVDWVSDNPKEPVVIFSKFRATIEVLHELLSKVQPDVVVGGGHHGLPESFLSGKTNVLLGTIAAMGEGLNLQRANTAIFVDQEWSTIKMQQAFDRIHRLGIDSPKLIYLLRGINTVDRDVIQALQHKWSVVELVKSYLRSLE